MNRSSRNGGLQSADIRASDFELHHPRPPAPGWGHTRGWSKKLHWFIDGRASCSGSQPRPGEQLQFSPSAEALREGGCPDCLNAARAHSNNHPRRNNRGIARLPQFTTPARLPRHSAATAGARSPIASDDLQPGHL